MDVSTSGTPPIRILTWLEDEKDNCWRRTSDAINEAKPHKDHAKPEIIYQTRISGPYGPFILAPAEGWWGGLRPIIWAFVPITI